MNTIMKGSADRVEDQGVVCRKARYPRSGFSLIEIMMAVLVLGTVVASTLLALRMGFNMIQLARDNTMAAQILQSEMENLRMMSWSELVDLDETATFQLGQQFDASIANRYTATRIVTPDPTRAGMMMEVELRIEWEAINGARHDRVYKTLFSKEGLNDYYYVIAR